METIVNNLINALGWSIFHSLWQGAIIYGILMLAIATLPRLNARIKYNLAYGAMILMFMGFCITFFSIFKLPAARTITTGATEVLAAPASALPGLPRELGNKAEHWFPYLAAAYGLGIFLQLLIIGAGYKKLLQLKNSEKFPVPENWQAVFEQLVQQLNLRRKTGFYLSAWVNVPLVIGYLKPVVLFPVALASQLDIKQVEAILIHELSHIRRNDYLLNLIKTGIETILFFNPFIWLSGRYINIEREHACDDFVLKLTGTPITYAHALLKLEILKNKATPVLSVAATGNGQHLYQRIKRITDMKTNYMNAKQQIFAITLTVATVISLAWISPAKNNTTEKHMKHHGHGKIEASTQDIKFRLRDMAPAKVYPAPHVKLQEDTTKKKKKFRIVTVDSNGVKKEYDSVKDMPDSLRLEVINDTFLNNMDFKFDFKMDSVFKNTDAFMNSPEFKAQIENAKMQANAIIKKLNTPEWRKQQADLQKDIMVLSKKINEKDMKKMQQNAKKMALEMKKHFNSPEFKKQQAELSKQAAELRMKFDSPEFKKQIEAMKKLRESPEYKELKEKFDKDIEQLKKEKGIKSNLKSLNNVPVDHWMAIPDAVGEIYTKVTGPEHL